MKRWKYFLGLIMFVFLSTGIISGFIVLIANQFPNAASNQPLPSENIYLVLRVIDGDTIEVEINGQKEKIRFIGINTPESNPADRIECYGNEAKQYTKFRLEGNYVSLVADPTQGERDKYKRLLRYIYIDGKDFNEELIDMGFAFEYTYDRPYENQSNYKMSMQEAVEKEIGMWAPTTCLKIYQKKL